MFRAVFNNASQLRAIAEVVNLIKKYVEKLLNIILKN